MRTLGSRSYRFTAASKSRIMDRQPFSTEGTFGDPRPHVLTPMGAQVVEVAPIYLREARAILDRDPDVKLQDPDVKLLRGVEGRVPIGNIAVVDEVAQP